MWGFWNNLKTTLLMSGLMGLCLGIGYLIGGPQAMLPALIFGGFMNVIAFFFSDKIALMTVRGREIQRQDDPVLYDTVAQLAGRANLPMPRVCISPAQAPNAFATGRSPHHSAVCVTAGLRQMLSRDELAGVIAHELSHVKHRDILISTIAAVFAGTITWISYILMFGRNRRSNPLVAILIIILAPIAASIIQMAISRSREYEADREGAEITGTGMGLANALRKLDAANRQIPLPVPDSQSNMFIVAPLTGSHFMKLFSTHPPIEERINRLRQMEPGLMA
ncbi:MAG: zinc metalloprotease HtpX [Sedimentisphaerales bacterium]|nr:zinc metalloprotease HtpX [Sedimentisphaerales bacterium]